MQARSNSLRRRSEGGFTLVELMVAVTVMAVGILAVGRLFIFSQHHATHGRSETMAVSLAQEIREKMLSQEFDDLELLFDHVDTTVPDTVTPPCQEWANRVATGLGPSGRGEIDVLTPDEDLEIVAGMLTIAIRVSWTEGPNDKSVRMRFSHSRVGI